MTNPNDPASPCKWTGNLAGLVEMPGLTKREYFAAMAMQGLCANVQFQLACAQISKNKNTHVAAEMALSSLDMADALIAELNKAPE